jgi:predicted nucleic acid-binding protein
MHHSGSPPDPVGMCVCDASFWINLVATRRAESLLRAIATPLVITDVALGELELGRAKGRLAAGEVSALVAKGLVQVVRCAEEDEDLFLSLIIGSAAETLDDGEAATLVYAARASIIAVIDERKATALAKSRFPSLGVWSTLDLLFADNVMGAFGSSEIADAIFDALTGARMRVPPHRLQKVVELLGVERAMQCPSLPARLRQPLELSSAEPAD